MATNPAQDLLSPTLTQLLETVRDAAVARVNAISWGQVESYDPELQEATIQLVPRRVWVDSTGMRQTERRAQLLDVPVLLPGSDDSGTTFDVKPGTFVLVLFLDQAADAWFRTGGSDSDPGDSRRHSLSDAVAIPGMRPRSGRLAAPPGNAVVQDPSKVQLGSKDASKGVLTAADAQLLMEAIAAAYVVATTPPVSSNPAAAGAALALQLLQAALGGSQSTPSIGWTTGSSKVKADT